MSSRLSRERGGLFLMVAEATEREDAAERGADRANLLAAKSPCDVTLCTAFHEK